MAQKSATKLRPPSKKAQRAAARRNTARRRHQLRFGALVGVVAVGGLVMALLAGGNGEEAPSGPTDRPFVGGDFHSLVVDPDNPSRAFVGGHQGVAVSTDGAETWRPVESLDGADAMGWAFTADRVLVSGHPGLFVSEDGGRTFEKRNEGLPATDLHAIGVSPDGSLIYVGSPQVGVFASEDGGRTWETRTEEVGQAFMGRILVDPEDPQHVVAPDMQAGAAESTDGGRTWNALGGVEGVMWVSWDPANTDHLVVSGTGGAASSTDGGRTWEDLDVPSGVSIVEIVPGRPDTLLAGAHDGRRVTVSVSKDGGKSWGSGAEPAAAPAFSLPTVGGGDFRLADHRGKVVVVDFLAVGCPSCAEEIPVLAAVADAFSKDQVRVVVVDLSGAPPDDIVSYYTSVGGNENLVYAIDARYDAAQAYGVTALGTTVVVDPTGAVQFRDERTTSATSLEESIREAMT